MNQESTPSSIFEIDLISNSKNNFNTIPYLLNAMDRINNNNIPSLKLDMNKKVFSENKFLFETDNKAFTKKDIKYGIDESGNPINIKEYYKSINDSIVQNTNSSIFSGITNYSQKLKKPIAYILKDENNNNILVDLKGNRITSKNKDGDYDFPLKLHVIIKDFDVKHPELRINGERNYKNENLDIIGEINDLDKEKDISHTNNTIIDFSNINSHNSFLNDNNILYGRPLLNNNNNEIIDSSRYGTNTHNYTILTKFSENYNLLQSNRNNSNNNRVVLRTKDILNNNNSNKNLSLNKIFSNKNINDKSITNYSLNKNAHTMDKYRSPSDHSIKNYFKYKRNIFSYKIKNKAKSIKSSLNINGINPNLIENKSYFYPSYMDGNKYDQYKDTLSNNFNNNNNLLFKSTFESDSNRQYTLNSENNIYRYLRLRSTNSSKENNNNYRYETNTHNVSNYFMLKYNKSFNNSIKSKKNKNLINKTYNKKVNTKPKFFPANNKSNINKSNVNIKKSNIKIINKNKLGLKHDISKKMKIPKSDRKTNFENKLKKIDISGYHINILSKEANNMIKSYSKRNIAKEGKFLKKKENIAFSNKKIPKVPKKNNSKIMKNSQTSINPNNSMNLNRSYFSSINKNNKNINHKEKIDNYLEENEDKVNQKYVGITLSLLNNKNKKNKARTNNQININFTPYQIECESLIKNNNNNFEQKKLYKYSEKNKIRYKKIMNAKKNIIPPNYEIYL